MSACDQASSSSRSWAPPLLKVLVPRLKVPAECEPLVSSRIVYHLTLVVDEVAVRWRTSTRSSSNLTSTLKRRLAQFFSCAMLHEPSALVRTIGHAFQVPHTPATLCLAETLICTFSSA